MIRFAAIFGFSGGLTLLSSFGQIRAEPVAPSGPPTHETGLVTGIEIVAESALAIRLDTSVVVFAKNIDEKRPVASTQKLLTALLIAEAGDLDARVAVQRTDGQVPPRNLWITQGSSYRRGTLLEMMLVRSFNDVTKCLARDHAGSQAEFAKLMNARAAELGMKSSHFVNAHGLTAEGQYSTARDMMRLAYAAWSREEIRRIVAIKETAFTYEGAKTIPVTNSNDLLHTYPECTGMKTGFTEAAGRCLVASASRGEKTVLAVILGSTLEDVWKDAETILKISLK
jgi:D-alanyl-D-alanine carboxypeptidase (penicillin-binding protein 5/6)